MGNKNKQAIPVSIILQPWPMEKRKAARLAVIWDLKTYKSMKEDIAAIEIEITEEAALSATDIKESVYINSKEIQFKGGFNTKVIIGHTIRSQPDPTASKAEAINSYRQSMYAATEYKEMLRRINAIERTLQRLENSGITEDNLKAKLIKMKYFEQDKSDTAIALELHIDKRTLYKWQNKVFKEIARYLGFII